MTDPEPADPKKAGRSRRFSPFLFASLGSLIVGLIFGMLLGGILPSFRTQPAPIEIALEPEGTELAPDRLMPDIRGLSEKDARQTLSDYGVPADAVTIDRVPHLSPEGFVVAQDPVGGTKNPGQVTLSLPSRPVMPDLAGTDEDAARIRVLEMGASATITRRYASGVAPGQVVDSVPKSGEPLAATVDLIVAATPQTAYLSKTRSNGSCSRNSVQVDGTKFENSVTCSARQSNDPSETYWLLNRRTAELTATLGMDDHSVPGTRARIVIDGDGRELFAGELVYGRKVALQVPTLDVLRLTVRVQRLDEGNGNATVVLGDAVVSGSVEDLASLEQR